MGDKFKKQQTKNFKKGRDLALEQAGKPHLFLRPEVIQTVFTLQPINGTVWVDGERLLALTEDGGGPVYAVRGHEKVGFVDGEGSDVLGLAIAVPNGPRVAELRITSSSLLSGVACAEIVVDDTGQ